MRDFFLNLMLVASISTIVIAEDAPLEEIFVSVRFDGSSFQLESSNLSTPLHFSGYEIEWTNEVEFKKKLNPKLGAIYQFTAQIVGTKPGTIVGHPSEAHTEYGAGYLIRYSLKIISADGAENKSLQQRE